MEQLDIEVKRTAPDPLPAGYVLSHDERVYTEEFNKLVAFVKGLFTQLQELPEGTDPTEAIETALLENGKIKDSLLNINSFPEFEEEELEGVKIYTLDPTKGIIAQILDRLNAFTAIEANYKGLGNTKLNTLDQFALFVMDRLAQSGTVSNSLPTISLVIDKTSITTAETATLTATANDSDGTIDKVEFYRNGSYIGEKTVPPYTLAVSGSSGAGVYNYTAKAFDDKNGSTTSNGVEMNIANAVTPPTITSFSPSSGLVGSTVTITGTNFTGVTVVRFAGLFSTFNVVNSTTITATVPTSATSGKITVETPNGNVTSAGDFTVTAPPATTYNTTLTPTQEAAGITYNGAPNTALKLNLPIPAYTTPAVPMLVFAGDVNNPANQIGQVDFSTSQAGVACGILHTNGTTYHKTLTSGSVNILA